MNLQQRRRNSLERFRSHFNQISKPNRQILNPNRLIRGIAMLLFIVAVGVWLFADTVRRYLPEQQDNGKIRFSYWGGFTDHRMWGEIISAFESSNPDIHIQPMWIPLVGYGTKLDQLFIAGSAPEVILFQDEPFPRYAPEQFADLTPFLNNDPPSQRRLADCWPTAVTSFMSNGSIHGLPIFGGNVLIFCNQDAFDRAGLYHGRTIRLPRADWTLDEFVELCKQLTIDEDGDGEPEQFAFLQPHWVYYLPFIWSCGARLLDGSKTAWNLTGPEALNAFTLYADLRHRYHVTPAPGEYAGQNSDTAFLSGRVAMCVNGPWFQPFLIRPH